MKIDFCIQGQGVMVRDLTVNIDWDCPYFPRIGETIDTNILIDNINPLNFYETLNDKEKSDWDNEVKSLVCDGMPDVEAMKACVRGWLDEMTLDVKYVNWCKNEEGIYLFIHINPNM